MRAVTRLPVGIHLASLVIHKLYHQDLLIIHGPQRGPDESEAFRSRIHNLPVHLHAVCASFGQTVIENEFRPKIST